MNILKNSEIYDFTKVLNIGIMIYVKKINLSHFERIPIQWNVKYLSFEFQGLYLSHFSH